MYEKYGTEWATEMMKVKKADVVRMFRENAIERDRLNAQVAELTSELADAKEFGEVEF